MRISGLQKLTLTDFPSKMACIVFTQGCNFKCPFCQNSTLIDNDVGLLDENEVFDYIKSRKNILEGVVVSGGEPTVQKDLKLFITKIKELGLKIKLDTNGANPKMLKELLDNDLLDYVAMDIKNSFEHYNEIAGVRVIRKNLEESIKLLKESNIDFEFRTTIIKEFHNIDKIKEIIKIVDGSKYFLQNFEDSEYVINHSLHPFSKEELEELNIEFKDYKNVYIRGIEK